MKNGLMQTRTDEQTMMTTVDEAHWTAVLARDRGADGTFVYAVRTTGIYCRPSCPSRKPAKSHVAFFASPGEAERGGFRPCRRCRPQDAAPIVDPWIEKIRRACGDLINV